MHSTADADATHAPLADESVCIGPPPSKDSYLNLRRCWRPASITGADAAHAMASVGRNEPFAEGTLAEHKLDFIGPKADIFRLMGDKIEAKKTAKRVWYRRRRVPRAVGAEDDAMAIAEAIGFPVLVKRLPAAAAAA